MKNVRKTSLLVGQAVDGEWIEELNERLNGEAEIREMTTYIHDETVTVRINENVGKRVDKYLYFEMLFKGFDCTLMQLSYKLPCRGKSLIMSKDFLKLERNVRTIVTEFCCEKAHTF